MRWDGMLANSMIDLWVGVVRLFCNSMTSSFVALRQLYK